MPYFKCGKYEIGMSLMDSAVKYNFKEYINYRAFIKCIFQKNYTSAIEDFNKSVVFKCDNYIMDHTRNFYVGLCFLQLNKFYDAEITFNKSTEEQITQYSKKWVSYLDKFYLGITYYELGKYAKAIKHFNAVIDDYEHFSDAKYYKALSLIYLGEKKKAKVYWRMRF